MASYARGTTVLIMFLMFTIRTFAAPAPAERKLLVRSHRDHRALPAAVEREPGLRRLANYPAMYAIAVPEKAMDRVTAILSDEGFEGVELEDVIRTPRRTILSLSESVPSAPYREGLFLLQYIAPPTLAWQTIVREEGIRIVDAIPDRAMIVSATADQIAAVAKFPWIQYAGP